MKKLISIVLSALLAALTLASCAQKGTDAPAGPSTDAQQAAQEKDGVHLQFMGWEASVYETESNKAALDRFVEDHPGMDVEYISGPTAEHHTKLLTMMAGNAAPDCFYMDPMYYKNFADRGMLLDLTPVFTKFYKEDEFIDWSRQKMVYKDKYYGIDSCIVGFILFYNQSLFEQAGIEPPPAKPEESWTWDQFLDAAEKLTLRDGGQTRQFGCFGFENNFGPLEQYATNEGVRFFDESGRFAVSDPQTLFDIMERFRELRTLLGASPEVAFADNSGMSPNQMLQTGKVAMVCQGSYSMQELAKMDFAFGAAPLPRIAQVENVVASSYNVAAWSGTRHPDETMELATYLSSVDFQLPFVREGLWMPNRVEMYRPENISKWLNPEIHPANFADMISIFQNGSMQTTNLVNNGSQVYDILNEEIQKYYFNDQPAQMTLDNMTERVNEAMQQAQ